MFDIRCESKTLEVFYSNEVFRYRLFELDKSINKPSQKGFMVKVQMSILNTMLNRLYQTIETDYDHEAVKNIGRLLYRQLIPDELAKLLSARGQSIMITSEDHSIPWELLHDDDDFLGIKHNIGRCLIWNQAQKEKTPDRGGDKGLLIISNPTGDLKEAEAETYMLKDYLRSRNVQCNYMARFQVSADDILMELNSSSYDFIHYCGHIVKNPENNKYAFLLANNEYFSIDLISKLNFGNPFVFINGCSSGKIDTLCTNDELHTSIEGVAIPFIEAGACAVIGSLWKVSDVGARKFAEGLYSLILNGVPVGDAMSATRKKMLMEDKTDPAWTSFVLYGSPGLYFTGSQKVPEPPVQLSRGKEIPHQPVQKVNDPLLKTKDGLTRIGELTINEVTGMHINNEAVSTHTNNESAGTYTSNVNTGDSMGIAQYSEPLPVPYINKDVRSPFDFYAADMPVDITIESDCTVSRSAGFWLRLAEYVIDFIIAQAGAALIRGILGGTFSVLYFSNGLTEDDLQNTSLMFLFYSISLIIDWLYYALFESSALQATPGKKMLGIKVTDMQGGRISFGRASARYFSKYLSMFTLYIGYIIAAFTPKKQALHDLIARTLVVKKTKQIFYEDIIY